MKIKLFIIIIIIQIIIISLLSFQIYQKQKNILGETAVNPIKKENLIFPKEDELKYFYEPKPNVTQIITKNWLPYQPKYKINSDSLNERFNYSVKKPPKTYRIIALGDSFTFGQNVSTERNWVETLEDKLNKNLSCPNIHKFEVINLGVYGYDVQYAIERFIIRGKKYNPDLVIWTYAAFERILEKMMPYIEENKDEAENLENQGIYYKNWNDARDILKKEIGTEGFLNNLKEQLEKFNNVYKDKLLLVYFPNYQIYINELKKFSSQRPNTYIHQLTINWDQKEYFLPDSHLNDFGHQKVAEEMFNFLLKNHLIPCQ